MVILLKYFHIIIDLYQGYYQLEQSAYFLFTDHLVTLAVEGRTVYDIEFKIFILPSTLACRAVNYMYIIVEIRV